MTDTELLQLAAKAAGIENSGGCYWTPNGDAWNPLTDDGDALRLAVSLGLVVDCSRPSAGEPYKQHSMYVDEMCDTAPLTRRAIVRAAAAMANAA